MCMYTCVCVYMCVCMCMYTCVCVCVCVFNAVLFVLAMSEIPGVIVLPAGDITEEKIQSSIVTFLKDRRADVVLR